MKDLFEPRDPAARYALWPAREYVPGEAQAFYGQLVESTGRDVLRQGLAGMADQESASADERPEE